MKERMSLPSDLDESKCELWHETHNWDSCNYTVNYRMAIGWTHSRVIEYEYAVQWLRYMAAFDAWQIKNGYHGFDGDAEFRKVWAAA